MSEDRCPKRTPLPCGCATVCVVTGALLSAGPCPENCEHRPVEARG